MIRSIDQAVAATDSQSVDDFRKSRRRRRRHSREAAGDVQGIAASYARYSSDQQREESIADQRRKCREKAEELGLRMLPELEYSDEAVSGTKLRRTGLDAMLRDAEAGEFQVLLFHSLSRLSRESVITMPMLKRLVHVFHIRIISVSEGIDSDKDGWDVIASIMALLHERYIKELSGNVFRGQEGTVLAGYCVGDYRFGYCSEPVPGSEQTGSGKNAKPRMAYAVDPVTAPWVLRIFRWFVKERRSLRWITQELNKRGAPKDHRSSTPDWHHQQVANLLSSPKYVGIWTWGELRNERDPLTGKVRQELRDEEESAKWTRQFPELRIVDDELFDEAQRLLDANYQRHVATRRADGKLKGSRAGSNGPAHLLSGLIRCGECGSTFHVGGSDCKYLFCPGYRKGICSCQTNLRRERAERLILGEIGRRIDGDPAWLLAVYEATLKAWQEGESRIPAELAAAEQELAGVDTKIARLVDRIENGLDDPSVSDRLQQHRGRRRELSKKVDRLKRQSGSRGPAPTESWVRDQLRALGDELNCNNPAAAYALRDLVGGSVVVNEIRREGRARHHLQGRFSLHPEAAAEVIEGHGESNAAGDGTRESSVAIVIDFVDENPLGGKAAEARAFYDQGLKNREIAQRLACSTGQVTKLIRHSFALEGKEMPDGRSRRTNRSAEDEPPFFERVADDVKRLADEGLLFGQIGERLACDRSTVTKAWRYWHESRELPVPDGRTRRKSLEHKQRSKRPATPTE